MKVLLDTNIWISALIWGGQVSPILLLAEETRLTLIISDPIFNELSTVIRYKKLQRKIRSAGATPDTLLEIVQTLTELHPAASVTVPELRDPKDAIILGTAIASNADVIVTGDQDLLVLTEFSGIPILTPQDFLRQYFPHDS